MSTDGGLEDLPLIDLFRAEVETHAEVLSSALLALERSPGDTSRVSEMMRAAHSIKGAARVVGVDPAVSVAHVMEDCFVAAQKGALSLSPADVDVLLRGVDLLGRISEATRDPKLNLAKEFETAVNSQVVELQAMLGRGDKPGATAAPVPSAVASSPPRDEPLDTVTIHFPVILDARAAEELRKEFLAASEQGCTSVWLDLRATRDLDVQGLAFLAVLPLHAAKVGRPQLRLAGLSAEMETVLKVTGLSEPYAASPGVSPEDK
jgi:two-component system sensor histidine kinase and response regulator WspE